MHWEAGHPQNSYQSVSYHSDGVRKCKYQQSFPNLFNFLVKTFIVVSEEISDLPDQPSSEVNHRNECSKIVNSLQTELKPDRDKLGVGNERLGCDCKEKENYEENLQQFLLPQNALYTFTLLLRCVVGFNLDVKLFEVIV